MGSVLECLFTGKLQRQYWLKEIHRTDESVVHLDKN